MPAASAARAMNPKWRLFAKLCTCSTHIPVKLATSESVKIFWLDFTVTMARLLCSAPKLLHAYLDAELMVCAVLFLSNSRSVLPGKNYPSSTFALKSTEFGLFPHFSTDQRPGTKGRQKAAEWQKYSTYANPVTVFGRESAISRTCFPRRISSEALNFSQSSPFIFPRNVSGLLYF